MIYFVFRASDRVLLYQAHRQKQAESEWVACLGNEGGVDSDYVRIEDVGPVPTGYVATLHPRQDKIVYIENPVRVEKASKRASGRAKLKTLGLNDEELQAMGLG